MLKQYGCKVMQHEQTKCIHQEMTKFSYFGNRSLSKLKPVYTLNISPNLHLLNKNQNEGNTTRTRKVFKRLSMLGSQLWDLNDMR